jgi:hypothetical protein
MALWLQRQEAVFLHGSYLIWLSQRSQSANAVSNADHDHDYDSDSGLEIKAEDLQPTLSNINPTLPIAQQTTAHILAKTPAHPRQSVQHLITAHGATSFLPALQLFLCEHIPRNNIVPGLQDRFDVFRQVVIVAPPDLRAGGLPKRWRIRATPEVHPGPGRKPGFPARFDMALIAAAEVSSSSDSHLRTLQGMLVI